MDTVVNLFFFFQNRDLGMKKKTLGQSCILRLVKAQGTFHLLLMWGGRPGQRCP